MEQVRPAPQPAHSRRCALVSVLPQVGEVFTHLFGLENRGFALLSFATLLLFALFLYLLNQVQEASGAAARSSPASPCASTGRST